MRGKRYTQGHDPCIYYNKLHDGEFIYLLLYVNNMLIASKSKSTIDKLKKQLSPEFEIKNVGEAKKGLTQRLRETEKEKKFA